MGAAFLLPGLVIGYSRIENTLRRQAEVLTGIEGALRQQAERLTRIERGLGIEGGL